jgi:hypothetical protein
MPIRRLLYRSIKIWVCSRGATFRSNRPYKKFNEIFIGNTNKVIIMGSPAAPSPTFSNNSDCIRKSLSSIVKSEGVTILDDPKRVRGLLADHCPGENKREIVILTRLLEEHVHQDLIRDKDSVPYNLLSVNITQRILANHPFDIQLAEWGVDTISVALGIIQNEQRNRSGSKPFQNSSNSVIRESDQNCNDLISQAILFNQSNRFHEALNLLNSAIKKEPSNAQALREKGLALSNLGRYDEALHWYEIGRASCRERV